MGHYSPKLNNHSLSINTFFYALIILYAGLGYFLIWHIPYTFPFGGPDEPMHLSMAEFIAKHLSWPDWDDKEVVRNAYGVSYSAGGSIVYWLHGLSYRIFGMHRMGAFLLLLVYLALSVWGYRKNILAGFLLLAGLLPQTLFIFSYVNSDSGTIITALMFGMAVGLFVTGEEKVRNMLIFFFFAGLAVTARQHLWGMAFLTFSWAIVYKRRTIMRYPKKYWLIGVGLALLPASWWFITSYLANAGDILGIFTNAKSIAKFGDPSLPSLARDWSSISIAKFLNSTLLSLYAKWGWTSLGLKPYEYFMPAALIAAITVLLYRHIEKHIFFFFVMLVAFNFGFMLLYSTLYDYQPQGRYLFPSVYIVLGIIVAIVIQKRVFSRSLLYLVTLLSILSLFFSMKIGLFSYVDALLEKPKPISTLPVKPYEQGLFHIDNLKIVDEKLFIRGWAFDKIAAKPFDPLYLVMKRNEKTYKILLEKGKRPDVAAAFKNETLMMSGFSVGMIGVKQLEKGTYNLFLLTPQRGILIPLNKDIDL